MYFRSAALFSVQLLPGRKFGGVARHVTTLPFVQTNMCQTRAKQPNTRKRAPTRPGLRGCNTKGRPSLVSARPTRNKEKGKGKGARDFSCSSELCSSVRSSCLVGTSVHRSVPFMEDGSFPLVALLYALGPGHTQGIMFALTMAAQRQEKVSRFLWRSGPQRLLECYSHLLFFSCLSWMLQSSLGLAKATTLQGAMPIVLSAWMPGITRR